MRKGPWDPVSPGLCTEVDRYQLEIRRNGVVSDLTESPHLCHYTREIVRYVMDNSHTHSTAVCLTTYIFSRAVHNQPCLAPAHLFKFTKLLNRVYNEQIGLPSVTDCEMFSKLNCLVLSSFVDYDKDLHYYIHN